MPTVHQDNNRKARFPLYQPSGTRCQRQFWTVTLHVTSFKSRLKTHLFSQAFSHKLTSRPTYH